MRGNTWIRWRFTERLDDLDFADDLALLSSTRRQLQLKNERLNNASKGTGLKINITKTKVMRFNAASEENIIVNGEELEDVNSFVYLGAKVSTAGGADDDINSRLCKARAVFGKLSSVWKSSILSKSTKIRIFKSNVIAVLLYGCESWRMTKGDEAKLDTFQHKCLPRLLKVYWPMRVSNEEVHRRANTETISELVRKRSWTWIGHVLRMDNSCLPRVALTWPQKGNAREEDLKKRGEGLWRKRE